MLREAGQSFLAWLNEGVPGLFVINGKINPDPEADWRAKHFP
jgi:hypothetical protein